MRNENERVNKIKHCWADNALTLKFRTRWGELLIPHLFTMPPVICTCSYCSKCKVIGFEQYGKHVSAPTHRDHEKQDKQGPSIHQRHTPSTSASKHSNTQDPKGVKKIIPVSSDFLTDRYLTSNCINCADAINSCCLVLY